MDSQLIDFVLLHVFLPFLSVKNKIMTVFAIVLSLRNYFLRFTFKMKQVARWGGMSSEGVKNVQKIKRVDVNSICKCNQKPE